MKKILATLLIFSSIGLGVIAFGVGGSPRPNASADSFYRGPDVDRASAIVQLKDDPLSTYPATRPAHGRKIDFNSNAVRSYRAQLSARRNEFRNWLRANASRARITSEYDISLNAVAVQLNGTSLTTIAAAPMVQSVEYNALYHPNLSQSHFIINADPAWVAAGGRAVAGAGIKIGDIDTGIDETHPFFDPTGFSYPTGFPKCDAADSDSHTPNQDCRYVSPKVIVAKVFFNKNNQQNFDAQAIQDHGTHTAGIAAGIFNPSLNAVVDGVLINGMSGIAPGAWLGNYNVFPGDVTNARSEDILNAVDAAVADGMDVLNLSLGGSFHGNNDLLAIGLDQDDVTALLPFKVTMRKAEHISSFFEPFAVSSWLAGIGPADVHNRDPRELSLVSSGAQVVGDGVLAKVEGANVVFSQMAPWQFEGSQQSNLRRTFRHVSVLLDRLLANMGVAGPTPLLERFDRPFEVTKTEKRWLDGFYLDQPEEWDDPYRFFRW